MGLKVAGGQSEQKPSEVILGQGMKNYEHQQKKTKPDVPLAISKYMAELGRRGGKANKGKPGRSEICRKAAQVRWEKHRVKKAAEEAQKS